jgi:hypothetical protein
MRAHRIAPAAALASVGAAFACVGFESEDPIAAPLDASMLEASTATDAGPFCARGTFLACEDFEQGGPEDRGWLADVRFDGGEGGVSLVVDPEGRYGRIALPPHVAGTGTAAARWKRTVITPGTTNVWTLAFDLRVASRSAAYGDTAVLELTTAGSTVPVVLYLTEPDDMQLFADLPDGALFGGPNFAVPPRTWQRITMRVERSGNSATLIVTRGTEEVTRVSGFPLPTTENRLVFGLTSTTTTGAVVIDVDNVTYAIE